MGTVRGPMGFAWLHRLIGSRGADVRIRRNSHALCAAVPVPAQTYRGGCGVRFPKGESICLP